MPRPPTPPHLTLPQAPHHPYAHPVAQLLDELGCEYEVAPCPTPMPLESLDQARLVLRVRKNGGGRQAGEQPQGIDLQQ